MIDGIKMGFRDADFANQLFAQGIQLNYSSNGNAHVKYKGLIFCMYRNGYVEVRGSLHKYFKGENYSDFDMHQLCQAVDSFCQEFQLQASNIEVRNIEFGVNISPPFSAFDFCTRLLYYGNEAFQPLKGACRAKRIGFLHEAQQYKIKCYDKSRQYAHLDNDSILRVEVAVNKMVFLKKTGIKTLADVKCRDKVSMLGVLLSELYSHVLVRETIDMNGLSQRQAWNYRDCINPHVWEGFTPQQRYRKKAAFLAIQDVFGQTQMKQTVADLICKKVALLIS